MAVDSLDNLSFDTSRNPDDLALRNAVEDFYRSINPKGRLGLIQHQPAPGGRVACCLANVYDVTLRLSGDVQFGWYFLVRRSQDFGYYLIATHHAVWQPEEDDGLVDVTPFHPDRNHQPIAANAEILFLWDRSAVPHCTATHINPLPTRFYPVSCTAGMADYLEQLERAELATWEWEVQKFAAEE